MKNVQRIVELINEQRNLIDDANEKIKELTNELLATNDDDWDWVSVKRGADAIGVSVCTIYRKIDSGEIKQKKVGGKIFVSLSELKNINDGVA